VLDPIVHYYPNLIYIEFFNNLNLLLMEKLDSYFYGNDKELHEKDKIEILDSRFHGNDNKHLFLWRQEIILLMEILDSLLEENDKRIT